MGDYIHSIFIIVAEVYCCILLFQSFAKKRNEKNRFIALVGGSVLGTLYLVITFIFYKQFYFRAMAIFSATSIIMYWMFQIRYLKALVLSMCFYGVDLIAEYTTIIILGKIYSLILDRAMNLSDIFILNMVSLISKMLLFGIILLMRKVVRGKDTDVLTSKEWWILFFISFITIFSLVAIVVKIDLFNNTNQKSSFLFIAMGMLLINFIVYYLINDIMEREVKIRENEFFREQIKNETAMYHSISENLEKQRKRTHEYKNQIAVISALVASGQYEGLKEYIEKIDNSLRFSMDAIDTNNVIVNAILNTKYQEMVNKGIVFVLKVNNLSEIKIEEEDIVVILSNLLNNAVEACEYCEDKIIKCKFILEKGQIMISVKNSMRIKPIVEKEKFLTTRSKDAAEHGMGIGNVVETVEKYGGRYVIDYDDKGTFLFSIMLPNPIA